uniref:Cyan fluorescent protein FP486 n=1 Tax=Entacmaea quadricolor TaxID=6118 RepID=Q5ZQQ6_ENTQU|nr:cyan fluorescent protein FP486 [Entacmaea quadricolor]
MDPLVNGNLKIKMFMNGSVNKHKFKCEAEGEGNIHSGTHIMKITVTEGGPLPFAFDILSRTFCYGHKMFLDNSGNIPDFFKQSLKDGYSWERETTYEDGGVLNSKQKHTLKGDCITTYSEVTGTFPPNGPVMKKKTLGWEPSCEMVIPRDGGLIMYDNIALKLDDDHGGHLTGNFKATYKSNNPNINLPKHHFVENRVEMLEGRDGGNYVKLHERNKARYSALESELAKK